MLQRNIRRAICRPAGLLDRSTRTARALDRSAAEFAHGCTVGTAARRETFRRVVLQLELFGAVVPARAAVERVPAVHPRRRPRASSSSTTSPRARAYVRVGDETTPLAAGDIVMMPHGDAHEMGAGVGGKTHLTAKTALPALMERARAAREFRRRRREDRPGVRLSRLRWRAAQAGARGPAARRAREYPHGSVRRMARQHAAHAVAQAALDPGSEVILAHLAEVLFTEVLRRYLLVAARRAHRLARRRGRSGRGPRAGGVASRTRVRLDAGRCWRSEAGISRSALTEKFTRYHRPGAHGLSHRLALELGAEALRSTSRSVQRVALDSGYESEAAFNRAFKRRFSVPPARYRREAARSGCEDSAARNALPRADDRAHRRCAGRARLIVAQLAGRPKNFRAVADGAPRFRNSPVLVQPAACSGGRQYEGFRRSRRCRRHMPVSPRAAAIARTT